MGLKHTTYSTLFFALILVFSGNSHAQMIAEQQLSEKIITNFKKQYKGDNSISWKKVESESFEYLVKGEFQNSGDKISATYNQEGSRIYENVSYKKSHIPAPLLDYVYTHFEKVKVLSLIKHTNYEQSKRGLKSVNYEMKLKVAGKAQTVWFNEELRIRKDVIGSKLVNKTNSSL